MSSQFCAEAKTVFSVCFRSDNKVTVNFINRDGEKITVKGSPGDSLLDLVINEDLDFDGFGMSTHTHTHTDHPVFPDSYHILTSLFTLFTGMQRPIRLK